MTDRYCTPEFEAMYTYHGTDLGSTWEPGRTTFRIWAPTAQAVSVRLYRSGTPGTDDLLDTFPLRQDLQGTWTAEKSGNLHGLYYTYLVSVDDQDIEAIDPYARACGVNGQRAMILDLSVTNPSGWQEDKPPAPMAAATDAVIYELHIRDFSQDESSGIANKGTYLAFTESGTRTPGGCATGLDYLKELGITHLHLLPFYDFGSVDESDLTHRAYNWGYDPVNFNIPEGSYSTDPFHGEVRIQELKQAILSLHRNGIRVVMDVVYNHVYDAGQFCFNRIVPGYFSRITNGIYSNGSSCGNDTASERTMVRKYIIDSLCYWADEYHIDGFRFDLVGLLDVDTINEAITQVHRKNPHVIFYGEGWNLPTQTVKPCTLALQTNSHLTPGFAYFSDTIRDTLRGSVFYSDELGFITGQNTPASTLASCFCGIPAWCPSPSQSVNYVSCHDNNTLLDRIALALPHASRHEQIRRSRLAAAFCLCAQGIPFFLAGEELLRSKPDGQGGFVENSYRSPDSVNSIKWGILDTEEGRKQLAYYKGLLAFRKTHPLLRLSTAQDVSQSVSTLCSADQAIAFLLRSPDERIIAAFNASCDPWDLTLPAGLWQVFANSNEAGVSPLLCVQANVTLPPLSALLLVQS